MNSRECARCEHIIDEDEPGGYLVLVAQRTIEVPYHRQCWDEARRTWEVFVRSEACR
jgi:hypothetical protein